MFVRRELATVLAALRYWQEEITPHGEHAARKYFESLKLRGIRPLSAAQIVRLSKRLRTELETL